MLLIHRRPTGIAGRIFLAIACLCIGLGVGTAPAEAATKKKRPVAGKSAVVKKTAKSKSATPHSPKYAPPRHTPIVQVNPGGPQVQSTSALVAEMNSGSVLFEKNANAVVPIASITKLMTAMVVLDSKPGLDEILTIEESDIDNLKGTHSRLPVGSQLTRSEMLRLALMASENRAAAALSRYYPGGRPGFVAAMNRKATQLGLSDTRFEDPTGLTAANVSSARDLTRMVAAAHQYPLIREFSTTTSYEVNLDGQTRVFHNTNRLVASDNWQIGLSKTGFISEAGKCLVMLAWFNGKPLIIVLLDSWGKLTRIGDANRIKHWLESPSLSRNIRG